MRRRWFPKSRRRWLLRLILVLGVSGAGVWLAWAWQRQRGHTNAYADEGKPRGGMGIDWGEYRPGRFAAVVANFANEPNTFTHAGQSEASVGPRRVETHSIVGQVQRKNLIVGCKLQSNRSRLACGSILAPPICGPPGYRRRIKICAHSNRRTGPR